jgi:hypothetical protein
MTCSCQIWSRGLLARLAAGVALMCDKIGRVSKRMPEMQSLTSAGPSAAVARPSANPSSFRLSVDQGHRSQSIETCACPRLPVGEPKSIAPAIGAPWSYCLSHDLDFAAVLGARLFQRNFGEENAFAASLVPRAEHPRVAGWGSGRQSGGWRPTG